MANAAEVPSKPRLPTSSDYDSIPGDLRNGLGWVLGRLVWNPDKRKHDKVPVDPRTGERVPGKTLEEIALPFAECRAALLRWRADGMGPVLAPPFFCVDQDRAAGDGNNPTWGLEIVAALGSWTERSLHGGFHSFGRGVLPSGHRTKYPGFEVYTASRFIFMTGWHQPGTPERVEDRQSELEELCRKQPASATPDEQLLAYLEKNSNTRGLVKKGWEPSEKYPTQSEADNMLICVLVSQTRDVDQIERVARRTRLMRGKWDERRGEKTWLRYLIEQKLAQLPDRSQRYVEKDGQLCRYVHDARSGITSVVPLGNFTARITAATVVCDGAEQVGCYTIKGTHVFGDPFPTVSVPTARYNSMTWVQEHWPRATLSAGHDVRDQAREAIQRLSEGFPEYRRYGHTGWIRLGGEWDFLSAAGALRREGVAVELPAGFERYARLPHTLLAMPLQRSFPFTLELLGIAPHTVTIPLLYGALLPLLNLLSPELPADDVCIETIGPTGGRKTALNILVTGGQFAGQSGEGDLLNWTSTANANERALFVLKDCPALVDELPLEKFKSVEVSRIIHAQRNRMARGRLRADTSVRPSYPPRAGLLTTGEQLVGHRESDIAGALIVQIEDLAVVDNARLAKAQAQAGILPVTTAHFIDWLARQEPVLRPLVGGMFAEFRQRAGRLFTGHERIRSNVAHVALAAAMFHRFACESGVIGQGEREVLDLAAWESLVPVGRYTASLILSESPVYRAMEALAALLGTGEIRVVDAALRSDPVARDDWKLGRIIGWEERPFIYAQPALLYQKVVEFHEKSRAAFGVTRDRLFDDLEQRGILVRDPKSGRRDAVMRVGRTQVRVLRLDSEKFHGFFAAPEAKPEPPAKDVMDESKLSEAVNKAEASLAFPGR
jgi:hypothetical protein